MKSEWRRMSTGRGFWLSVVLRGGAACRDHVAVRGMSGTFLQWCRRPSVQSRSAICCRSSLFCVGDSFSCGMEERISESCAASDWQAGLCGNKNSDSSWRRDSGCVAGGDSGNLWKLSCVLSTGEGRRHCSRACPNACRYSIALQPWSASLCLTWRNLRDFYGLLCRYGLWHSACSLFLHDPEGTLLSGCTLALSATVNFQGSKWGNVGRSWLFLFADARRINGRACSNDIWKN